VNLLLHITAAAGAQLSTELHSHAMPGRPCPLWESITSALTKWRHSALLAFSFSGPAKLNKHVHMRKLLGCATHHYANEPYVTYCIPSVIGLCWNTLSTHHRACQCMCRAFREREIAAASSRVSCRHTIRLPHRLLMAFDACCNICLCD
jgi:hypothetical protein